MRIMIDTNIIISAILFPNGKASQALYKALTPPHEPYICDYIIDELREKFKEKFSNHVLDLERFLDLSLETVNVVPTPDKEVYYEQFIRDIKDRPILRSAIQSNIDYLLTGDKDFIEANIKYPRVITIREFLNM